MEKKEHNISKSNSVIAVKWGCMSATRIYSIALIIAITASACNNKTSDNAASNSSYPDSLKLFTQLDSSVTGIDFRNDIIEDENTNAIVYEYTYNGGGVAIGDVNN